MRVSVCVGRCVCLCECVSLCVNDILPLSVHGLQSNLWDFLLKVGSRHSVKTQRNIDIDEETPLTLTH